LRRRLPSLSNELVLEPGSGCSIRVHEIPIAFVMSLFATQTTPGSWSH